ncbi:MAG: translation initiation factor IF-6 [Candidatus Thermoplasmatota archaeon]|nr:translation initiation factor IF-6 [Candidatus Thermoplasmatota archaeon]
MALLQRDLFNSPYSGVFCTTNDALTLVPPGIPQDDIEAISKALETTVEVITIGGSRVIGTLITMNAQGLLLSNLVTSREIEKLDKLASDLDLRIGVISDRSNAIGNNFLVNDYGGFCNERLGSRTRELAQEVLGVEITPKSLNQMDTLGMIGCVTNKGGICHPDITARDRQMMEKVLDVPIMEGTVNFGMPLVGAGVVASSNGAVCSRQSTGVELGRVEEALRLF